MRGMPVVFAVSLDSDLQGFVVHIFSFMVRAQQRFDYTHAVVRICRVVMIRTQDILAYGQGFTVVFM